MCVLRVKKASWRSFISTFNRTTPLSHIWRIIKSFTRKRDPIRAFPHLSINGTTYSNPDDVVQIFAEHFERESSGNNLSSSQVNYFQELLQPCTISLSSAEDYNKPFTHTELTTAISNTGHTSVGPDGIHYDFFRHLSPTSLLSLLNCFNRVWETGEFPEQWLEAYIVPILKPGKSRYHPESYRPIALTSCACKLFEKLVNVRLRYYLEAKSKLDPFQTGFRKGRGTCDNILRLTYSIQRGFDQKQHTVAAFLDLTKAYDKVHPPALLYQIHNIGIRGNLAVFLKNFLQPRSFQVRMPELPLSSNIEAARRAARQCDIPNTFLNPRPAGPSPAPTLCWGGGGGRSGPHLSRKPTDVGEKFKRQWKGLDEIFQIKFKNLTSRLPVTSQVRSNAKCLTFSIYCLSSAKFRE